MEFTSPTTAEYVRALRAIETSVSARQCEQLVIHWACPDHAITAPELAEKLDDKHFVAVNSRYGRLGRLLRERLNRPCCDGDPLQQKIMVSFEWRTDGHWVLLMRPQFAAALVKLGWVK